MAALDFPNAPTNGQQWVGTNGATYTWDGLTWNVSSVPGTSVAPIAPTAPVQGQLWWRNDPDGNLFISYNDGNSTQWVPAVPSSAPQWVVSSGALTPVDATKGVAIPASGTGGAVLTHPLVLGARTVKSRIGAFTPAGTSDGFFFSVNRDMLTGVQDDATKSSWQMSLNSAASGDVFGIGRVAPAGAFGNLLTLDSGGNLTLTPAAPAGTASLLSMYGYQATAHYRGYVAAGTATAPTAITAGYGMLLLGGWGCYLAGNNYSEQAKLQFSASENWSNTARGTTAYIFVTPNGSTTEVQAFQFDPAGNFIITGPTGMKSAGTTWANPSDIRIKKNITDYTPGLDAILALRPIRFEHNGAAGTTDGAPGISFIADEVESVMPEMVGTQRAKLQPDDTEDTELKTLDVSPMLFAFVNAFKELAARVAALEAK